MAQEGEKRRQQQEKNARMNEWAVIKIILN